MRSLVEGLFEEELVGDFVMMVCVEVLLVEERRVPSVGDLAVLKVLVFGPRIQRLVVSRSMDNCTYATSVGNHHQSVSPAPNQEHASSPPSAASDPHHLQSSPHPTDPISHLFFST